MATYQRITLRAFISPRAAVQYIVRMDPRRAAIPLALLAGIFSLLAVGAVLMALLAYLVTWIGAGDGTWFVALAVAPAVGLVCFAWVFASLRRASPSLHARAALLLLLGGTGPLILGGAVFLFSFLGLEVASSVSFLALGVVLLWCPIFVMIAERGLHKGRYDPRFFCAGCGYCLVRLPTRRCPECGLDAPPV